MGEHSDQLAVAAVAGRRSAPSSPASKRNLVPAVAPADVLERALADRRPEARARRPSSPRHPASVRAGDLAHVQRLAPVFDPQAATGGWRCGRRRRRRRRAGAGRQTIAASTWTPSSTGTPPPRRARRCASMPSASSDRVGDRALRRPRTRASGSLGSARISASSASGSSSTPRLLQPGERCSAATSLPSRSTCGAASSVAIVTSAPRIASEAAASQPMKPEPTTSTASPRPSSASCSESAIVRIGLHVGAVGAGDRRHERAGRRSPADSGRRTGLARRRSSASVLPRSISATSTPSSSSISCSRYQSGAASRQLAAARLAAQVLLGQRRAFVGRVGLAGEDRHRRPRPRPRGRRPRRRARPGRRRRSRSARSLTSAPPGGRAGSRASVRASDSERSGLGVGGSRGRRRRQLAARVAAGASGRRRRVPPGASAASIRRSPSRDQRRAPVVEDLGADDRARTVPSGICSGRCRAGNSTFWRDRRSASAGVRQRGRAEVDGEQAPAARRQHLGEDADRAAELQRAAGPLAAGTSSVCRYLRLLVVAGRVVPGVLRLAREALEVLDRRAVVRARRGAHRRQPFRAEPRQQRVEAVLEEEGLEVAAGAVEAAAR